MKRRESKAFPRKSLIHEQQTDSGVIMKLVITSVLSALLVACASNNPGGYDTADLWREHCASNAGQVDTRTNVTVEHWDDEATTAGHRGTRTDNVMEPDANQAPPRGC